MQQIADWLENLGMSEYAQRFAENGIDVAALRHLTDQDLKDIGVLLGHRRKMLAAIGELAGAASTTRTDHHNGAEAPRHRGTPPDLNSPCQVVASDIESRSSESRKATASRARFSGSDLSIHTRSLADFITIMCGFRFSVHTPPPSSGRVLAPPP
jgi:hypothetical protein